MDENTAADVIKNNPANKKSKYDAYLEKLEKWRADHKKDKVKPSTKPLRPTQNINQIPVRTQNKPNVSSTHKRLDTRRATQEITRSVTKRQDPRRKTQEIIRPSVNKLPNERRLTQGRISNIVPKAGVKGTAVNKVGLSSVQNNKKLQQSNNVPNRRASVSNNAVNPRRLTQPVREPLNKKTDKKPSDPPAKLRRLTQDVVRPLTKRNDPRRLTQPVKSTFTRKSNGSAPPSSVSDDKVKNAVSAVRKQEEEDKESPDMRHKLDEWQQKKQASKTTGSRSTGKVPPNRQPNKIAIDRRKTFSTGGAVKRCDQPKGACKAKVETRRQFMQSLTRDKINHRRSMLPGTRPGTRSSAASTTKRSRSFGGVQDSHVNQRQTSAFNHTPVSKNINKCTNLNSTAKKRPWSSSTQVNSVRKSPRSAASSRVRHASASAAVKSKVTGRYRTISGTHVANPADPGKVKARKSILKHCVSEEIDEGQIKVIEEEGRKVKVTFQSPALSTPQQKAVAPKTPASKKEGSMRSRLDTWLTAKGKTPSRFQHLRCFGVELSAKKKKQEQPIPYSPAGLSTVELEHQQALLAEESSESITEVPTESEAPPEPPEEDPIQGQLRQLLNECHALFEAGCPTSNITSWLDEIQGNIPAAMRTAEYWVCRAHIAEEMEDNNLAVDLFEQAVLHRATPASELAEALKAFVMRMEDHKKAVRLAAHTPGPAKLPSGMSEDNVFESSSVKYCVSSDTPLMKRLNPPDGKSTPRVVVTPVRRSTRRSTNTLPSMLQDHDVIVESLDEVGDPSALFQANRALEKDFEEAAEENV